ncbi:FAD-binding oxidoreductase [Streptomyces smaragdinus]|nr:FAD-binding oxidoreductase [Streptomyces smaragdinus]
MLWNGWGDPERATPLPQAVAGLLRELLGVEPAAHPPVALADVAVAPSRLTDGLLAALTAVTQVRTDDETRVRRTRGKSTPDLMRMRDGEAADAPDAVLLPASHDEVLAALRVCAEHGVAVVPFGGGTSVVGGLTPRTTGCRVALDLRRLNGMTSLDPVSRTAVLQAGLRAPEAERLLAAEGFTLGHFPQSFEWATIGGFAATRGSGQASAGYGRFDDMVVALTAATPRGTLDTGRAPRSAAGPDLRQLLLGSEGAFGVITSVTVRVRPLPRERRYEGWRFASFAEGTRAMRSLAQDGPLPTVLRLSDETETMVGLARPQSIAESAGAAGCLLLAGYEGDAARTEDLRARTHEALRGLGGEPLGDEPGEQWAQGRFDAPYLRDSLLGAGAFAETLETATFWSNIPALYTAVRDALTATLTAAGTPPLVMCHISHVYETGASLYFTVVCAQGKDDPLAHWDTAKRAANDAILAAGGTISHHHGVGTDHRPWYEREAGDLGTQTLRAVKAALDPQGILNPGVLVP